MKTELEEAAEKFIKKQEYNSLEIDDKMFEAIVFGAKWQQERSYSEEEVVNILIKAYEDIEKGKYQIKLY